MEYGVYVHEGTVSEAEYPGPDEYPYGPKQVGFQGAPLDPWPPGSPPSPRFIFPRTARALKLPWGLFYYVRGHYPRPFLTKALQEKAPDVRGVFSSMIRRVLRGL
jgi:hypothetical protein